MHENFSRYHAQWHITPPKTGAELPRIISSESQTPLPWPVCRLRMQSPGAFGDGIVLGAVAIHAFPYSFFPHPNLTWTDGDSSGGGRGLSGSLPGKCFNQGRSHCQSLWGARAAGRAVSRRPVDNWSGEEAVPAKSSSLWFRQLWCATERAFVYLHFPHKSILQYEGTTDIMYLFTKTKLFKLCNPP